MERKLFISVIVGLALATLGCGGDDDGAVCDLAADGTCPPGCPTDPDCLPQDGGGDVDGGAGDVDGGGSTCAATVPTRPFGVEINRKFEPITLNACDGTPYDVYGSDYCDASLTVISIAAGWCGPCIIESGLLTENVTEAYRDRGVRVIQVLYQTDDYGAPDGTYCDAWVSRFGLTNIELYDPTQLMSAYFPAGALPAALIIDNEGVIRYREYGTSQELGTLTSKIDELLAERGL